MNFELKTFDLAQAAKEKCDALIVLVNDSFKPEKNVLSALLGQALKAGDLDAKVGKPLVMYHVSGVVGEIGRAHV